LGLLIAVLVAAKLAFPDHAESSVLTDAVFPADVLDSYAPDFLLKDLKGKQYHLHDHVGEALIVIQFGSFTCPMCMWSQLDSNRQVQSPSPLDVVIKKYEGRVEFLFIYGEEAAPEPKDPKIGPKSFRSLIPEFRDLPPLIQTHSWEERAERAALFANKTKTLRYVLVDEDGANSVCSRYEVHHLQTVVVDLQGRIALRRMTIPAKDLDDFLQECLTKADRKAQ
jgi:hypothetical protein